jgi:hypothetical protein
MRLLSLANRGDNFDLGLGATNPCCIIRAVSSVLYQRRLRRTFPGPARDNSSPGNVKAASPLFDVGRNRIGPVDSLLQRLPQTRPDGQGWRDQHYALKELPQPQVDFTLGLLNLNPDPSSEST